MTLSEEDIHSVNDYLLNGVPLTDEIKERVSSYLRPAGWQHVATLETTVDHIRVEDSGAAHIIDVTDNHPRLWVPITSYVDEEPCEHPEIDRMRGKRIRVTIEVYE